MPRPGGDGAGGTFILPSVLAFRHWNGQPITLEDCCAAYRAVCAENRARAAAMKALEATKDPDEAREYKALCFQAQMGNARARAWGGCIGVFELAQEGSA
ncbi:hypothetical protein [Deinococcus ruber]|uniref:Uncharacterized protein n=1 Tax=Deinococcus ruber TaxID=1848197 RepID=A0A918CGW8_9DEIO|nr:hypothetical protein [Deinococcus ruber]GGR22550.1 hypothetical protein GCM10008957_38230 [Deinococcus ruber]